MSNCAVCNSVINSNRKGKIYCSNACKQRAYTMRINGISLTSTSQTQSVTYTFNEFKLITESLEEEYQVSYIEYCYIRSCARHMSNAEEIRSLIMNILDESYNTTAEARSQYLNGYEKYRSNFFEKALE